MNERRSGVHKHKRICEARSWANNAYERAPATVPDAPAEQCTLAYWFVCGTDTRVVASRNVASPRSRRYRKSRIEQHEVGDRFAKRSEAMVAIELAALRRACPVCV
jgi:hypothetical protein